MDDKVIEQEKEAEGKAEEAPVTEAPVTEKKTRKISDRRKYRNDQWSDEQVAARRAELTKAEIPAGWISMSQVDKAFKLAGVAVSRLVKATGGDRGMNPPLNENFEIVYVGRQRYLPPTVLTVGLPALQADASLAKEPRKPRVKKEKEEEGRESGPTKGALPDRPKPTFKKG